MNLAASGLSSGNKIATYHENRTQRKTDLTLFTKGQLRKHIESLEEKLESKDEEFSELQEKYRELRNKHLILQTEFINRFPEDKGEAYMKAG
jgi:uncharacterized protein HemX